MEVADWIIVIEDDGLIDNVKGMVGSLRIIDNFDNTYMINFPHRGDWWLDQKCCCEIEKEIVAMAIESTKDYYDCEMLGQYNRRVEKGEFK